MLMSLRALILLTGEKHKPQQDASFLGNYTFSFLSPSQHMKRKQNQNMNVLALFGARFVRHAYRCKFLESKQ